jgi:hypothetical protein
MSATISLDPLSKAAIVTVVAVALAVGAGIGYMMARVTGVPAVSVTGRIDMGESAGTADVDGQSYVVPCDIAWRGHDGSWNEAGSGRPECLTPGGARSVMPFWWVEVGGGRQVVAVDCSPAIRAE